MFDTVVEFLKEYGDVLGAIGTLSAFTMLVITNGRVIVQRLRGQKPISLQAQIFGGKTAIAVLPIKVKNPKGAVSSNPFADSLEEELHTDIVAAGYASPAPDLTHQVALKAHSGTEVIAKLGANYALETSVRQHNDDCRVTARLTDKHGAIIWSNRFDCSALDTIKAPEEMASRILKGISDVLAGGANAPAHLPNAPGAPITAGSDAVMVADGHMPALTGQGNRGQGNRISLPGSLSRFGMPVETSPKSRFIAFMLCFFLVGLFGAHRFYVGRPFTGILYILTFGLLTFGWFFDLILIALGMFADGKGRPVRHFHPRHTLAAA